MKDYDLRMNGGTGEEQTGFSKSQGLEQVFSTLHKSLPGQVATVERNVTFTQALLNTQLNWKGLRVPSGTGRSSGGKCRYWNSAVERMGAPQPQLHPE